MSAGTSVGDTISCPPLPELVLHTMKVCVELSSENDLFFHYSHTLDEAGFRAVQARAPTTARALRLLLP